MLIPPGLQPGDSVGIVAPSGAFEPERLDPAVDYLSHRGYRVVKGASLYSRHRYLAGTDDERSADLNAMFSNPRIRAVFVARGGYGATRLLDMVDYGTVQRDPKILVGFSDTTALQLALWAHADLVTYTGVTLCADVTEIGLPSATESSLWDALEQGRHPDIEGLRALRPGRSSGPLLGGCLSLVAPLVGTPHLPDLSGAVLFLEDVLEAPYRVDRMLTHLRQAGVFDVVSGLILGEFHQCESDRPQDGSVEDVLQSFAAEARCPVFSGLPYGHGPNRHVLPIGLRVSIDSTDCRLCIDTAGV